MLCPSPDGRAARAHSLTNLLSRTRPFAGAGGLSGDGFCQWAVLKLPCHFTERADRMGRVWGNWEGQSVGR